MNVRKPLNASPLTIPAGKQLPVSFPCDREQWVDVVVVVARGQTAPTTGNLTIGSAVPVGDTYYYPMDGKGYASVPYSNIAAPSTDTVKKGVVSFYAQPTNSQLGFNNETDRDLDIYVFTQDRIIAQ